ncbi:MAG: hypothetical protein GY811_28030 [Myxococcales bacterium]|nr:hypothetical protein [Myxococcales bacterium]
MAAHESANQTYPEEGVTLLELAHRAHKLFAKQEPKEKRRLLDFVLSNSSWANGELSVTYRQPFDIIAQATARNDEEATVIGDPLVNTEIWLPQICKLARHRAPTTAFAKQNAWFGARHPMLRSHHRLPVASVTG